MVRDVNARVREGREALGETEWLMVISKRTSSVSWLDAPVCSIADFAFDPLIERGREAATSAGYVSVVENEMVEHSNSPDPNACDVG